MNYNQAQRIFAAIEASNQGGLRCDFFERAINYAQFRARWPMLSFEQRRELDNLRTAAHNTFIDSCNILSRNMAHTGEDNSWRADLGDDRKVLGDFACFILLILGLRGRYPDIFGMAIPSPSKSQLPTNRFPFAANPVDSLDHLRILGTYKHCPMREVRFF